MIEIRLCASDADKEASLAIYNAVWPWNAVTMDEVRSFRAQMTHYADFLAPAAGLVAAAITPWRPEVALMFLTVLPEQRARGIGTALYREASSWIAQHGVEMMDAPASEDDLSSIAFAEPHGFQEITRSPKLILDEARPDRLGRNAATND